jgi:hypothetical protein
MGYPGDDGGGPPDTRRSTLWAADPDQDWPEPPADGPTPSGDLWAPAAAPGPPRQPTGPNYPNATTAQPGRPPQPGGAATTGPPVRGRTSHRRAPGPDTPAGPPPPSGADPLDGRDNRESRGRHGTGGSRGRRAAQPAAPPPPHEDASRRPPRRSSDELQGGTRPPGPAGTGGSLWSSGAFRTAGPSGRGPVRGYPPAPGAPDPVYPPGQFSPWNSAELRTAPGRPDLGGGPGPDPAEPGYSQLAVSDPSADATATQTWAVLDDGDLSGEWTSPPAKPPSPAGLGASPAGPGGSLPGPGARSPFEAADAAAGSPPWAGGLPGAEPPGGLTGPAAPAQRPDQAQPGYPGEPGAPRPGGRLAARRSREAAMDTAQDTAGDTRSRDTGGFSTGGFGTGDVGTRDSRTGELDTGGFDTGGFDTGGFDSEGSGTGGFGTPAEPGRWAGRDGSPAGAPPRGSRSAARGRTPRKPVSRVKMWLMPAGMLVLVATLITVVYLQFGKGQSNASSSGSAARHPAAAASSAPPGPWKHITTRQDDPMALTLAELFPARFTAGTTSAVRTVQKASGANCAKMVLGGKLQAALRKGGCTQVMRASYLAAGQKIMATIGVLNLANVTDTEQAGKATGASAFIKQLPGAKGPTRNLMNGTGLEEAEIKGHYLILTWAEFTSGKAPAGPKQRAQLDAFSRALVGSTANVSLTSRELLGKPSVP